MFGDAKDRFVEQAALAFLNNRVLTSLGRATRLRVDSGARRIVIELELKGEATPVSIEIADYEFQTEGGRHFLLIRHVRTSREWLTTLASTRFCDRKFELPEQAGQWLKRLL